MADNFATERVLLGPCVISFPSLFRPSEKTGKYEVDIIYPAGSETHKKIRTLEKTAINARWGNKPPAGLLGLVKNGDERIKDTGEAYEGYAGMLYSKVRSARIPLVSDVNNDPIADPMEIKGGDTCVVLAHAYPYANTEWSKKGVLLTLHGVRKIKDGEPLGGSSSANAAEELGAYMVADSEMVEDF